MSMFNHLPSFEMRNGAMVRLEAVKWHTQPGDQQFKMRLRGVWLEPSSSLAYEDPKQAWSQRQATKVGHIVTDGKRRAVLYLTREEAFTLGMMADVAKAAGMTVEIPGGPDAEKEMVDTARHYYPPFTADPVVAYDGFYESECGHHRIPLKARTAFPKCEKCGRRVQWRRHLDSN